MKKRGPNATTPLFGVRFEVVPYGVAIVMCKSISHLICEHIYTFDLTLQPFGGLLRHDHRTHVRTRTSETRWQALPTWLLRYG